MAARLLAASVMVLWLASGGGIFDECPMEIADSCEQICVSIVDGFFCDCYPGYKLNPNGVNCSDIDECATGNATCGQLCVNTEGSYECHCSPGFELNEDGTTCRVVCSSEEVLCYGEDICVPGRFRCDGIFDCLSGIDEAACQPELEACSTGDVRLAEGATPSEGRIELCSDDYWRSICSEGWDVEDASVVCQQLGLSTVGVPASARELTHDLTSIPILETEFQCNGDETTIFACPVVTGEGCDHFNDAGVRCLASDNCTHGDVRVQRVGDAGTVGRVELCYEGVWASVCNNNWFFRDASVVCQQLGYNPIGALPLRYAFEQPELDLFVLLSCDVDADSLLQCNILPTGSCSTFAAGVRCDAYPPNGCEDGQNRLTHRDFPSLGQVQVCVNNTWGTVCQSNWDNNEAQVVCRQLGYTAPGHQAFTLPVVAPGSGPIHLSGLNCNGSENSLLDCPFQKENNLSLCNHNDDVSVRCSASPVVVLRPEGPVEVEVNREFEAQCKVDPFTFPRVTKLTAFKNEQPIVSEEAGVYITVANYPVDGGTGVLPEAEGVYACVAESPAGSDSASFNLSVLVPDPYVPMSTIMRISFPMFERLLDLMFLFTREELLDIIASTVFNGIPADFPGLQTVTCNYVGRQEVDIEHMLERVECNIISQPPIEEQLTLISQVVTLSLRNPDGLSLFNLFSFSENGFCDADRVSTPYGTYFWPEIERLTLTSLPCAFGERVEGAIAIRGCNNDGTWGSHVFDGCVMVTVNCSSEEFLCPFDDKCLPQSVACDGIEDCSSGLDEQVCQLECKSGEFLCFSNDRCIPNFQVCDVTPHCSDVSDELGCGICGPLEYFCRHEGRCIPHNYVCDGYVDCLAAFDEYFCPVPPSNCTDGEMRIQDGRAEGEGRVEVCVDGTFRDVCASGWDVLEASIVCRELMGGVGLPITAIPRLTAPVLSQLQCTGNESSLLECERNSDDDCNLDDFEVAGVRCQAAMCLHGTIQLVDGANEREGHVEICIEGVWGLVSDLQWEYEDAAVVCRSLGYEPLGALPLPNTQFGISRSPVFYVPINCIGNENSIFDCFTTEELAGVPVDEGFDHEVYRFIAGVRCDDYNVTYCEKEESLRLTHRENERNGRVQSCINNTWSESCLDGNTEAREVCSQLDFLANGSVAAGGDFICNLVNCATLPVIRLFPPPTNTEALYSVEVGREFMVFCTVEDTYPFAIHSVEAYRLGEEPDNLFINATNTAYVLEISDNIGIAPEDAGTYICVAENPAGRSQRNIIIEVEEPNLAGSSSSILFRISFPMLDRIGIIFEDDGGFDGTRESLLRLLRGLMLNAIDEGLTGVPVVDCYYVGRLRIGVERQYDRAECNITNYPATDDMTTIADMVLFELLTSPNFFFFPRISALGFCDAEFVTAFHWIETEIGQVAVVPCPFGPEGINGTRLCGANGQWEAPNIDLCNEPVGSLAFLRFSTVNLSAIAEIFDDADPISINEVELELAQAIREVFAMYVAPEYPAVIFPSCSHVQNRPVDEANFWLRFECEILQSPMSNRTLEITEKIAESILFHSVGMVVLVADSAISSANGFCDYNETFSNSPGQWPETVAGNEATLTCLRGEAVPGGLARRLCNENAMWEEPDFSQCSEGFIAETVPESGSIIAGVENETNILIQCRIFRGAIRRVTAWFIMKIDDGNMVLRQITISDPAFMITGDPVPNEPLQYNNNLTILTLTADFDRAELFCGTPTEIQLATFTIQILSCRDGQVRLVGGSSESEGRVEFCQGQQWVTVCDNLWDYRDAVVVCRSLGYPFAKPVRNNFFGTGVEPVFLDNVECFGNETALGECPSNNASFCSSEAGAVCSATGDNCTDGDVRLVGSQLESRGRVEICISGVYGTVCDDSWDFDDATVVCRQRGFPMALSALRGAYFGEGFGAIYLDEVECDGTESNLLECSHSGLHNHDCDHGEDASVECAVTTCGSGEFQCSREPDPCRPEEYTCDGIVDCVLDLGQDENKCEEPMTDCRHGAVRLVEGFSDYEGFAEICSRGVYRRICAHFEWNINDASVICRQLGLPPGGVAFIPEDSRQGDCTGIRCSGSERNVLECEIDNDIGGDNDAGVECTQPKKCDNGEVRLVGGRDEREGRVELCYNGVWGSVGEEGDWGFPEAAVVCTQLGYNPLGAVPFRESLFGEDGPYPIACVVGCNGDEDELIQCFTLLSSGCSIRDTVGVRCEDYQDANCTEGDVRLVHRELIAEGVVQICLDGLWGTLCTDGFAPTAVNVVCTQLGFPYYDHYSSSTSQSVESPVHVLGQLSCNGSEDNLLECIVLSEGFGCSMYEVECLGPPRIRLDPAFDAEVPVEVGRRFADELICRPVDDYTYVGNISVFKDGELIAAGSRGDDVVVLGDDRITLEDAGNYSCVADNPLGKTYLNFTVTVLAPTVGEASSSAFMRLSIPEFERSILLFEESNRGCDQDFEGEIPDQLRRGVAEECPNTADPVTPDLLNQLLAERVLDTFPVNLVGIQVVSCAYVENRDIDIERLFQRVECIVRNYPPVEDILQLTERASAILDSRDRILHGLQLFAVSANGFCNPDSSGNYSWNETAAGNEATITCLTGEAVPGGLARRQCNGNAVWEEPDFSQCNEACEDRQVRLVGGSTESEGRVEVCLGIMWVTVCDSYWDYPDAKVLCSFLGYPFAKPVTNFGEKFGLLSVDCLGNESSLLDCSVDVIEEQCDAAGVVCSATGDNCTDGDVRLVGSQLESRGRVEICISGVYGTVCDDSWDIDDATVVCRQRGFPMALSALRGAYFGEGFGAIYLDEVECNGTESNLLECSHSGLHNHDCDHGEDASVECAVTTCGSEEVLCYREPDPCRPEEYMCDGIVDCVLDLGQDENNCEEPMTDCRHGTVRLVEGFSDYEGFAEICSRGVYRRICTRFQWNINDASVICRQLGLPPGGIAFIPEDSRQGDCTGIRCSGSERNVLECEINSDIGGDNDAGVECTQPETCEDGEVRLVGGRDEREGRVELCYNGVWGSVGEEGDWGFPEAAVVCTQLGYNPLGAVPFRESLFGEDGPYPIACVVDCNGDEEELIQCFTLLSSGCSIRYTVGVRCEDYQDANCTEGDVRLVHRSVVAEGVVQICLDGLWGTLCTDNFNSNAVNVVCAQLGFPYYDHYSSSTSQSVESPVHVLGQLRCNGSEDSLLECIVLSEGLGCSMYEVECLGPPRIRLDPAFDAEVPVEVGRRFADELICRPVDDYTYVEKISVFKDGELIAAGSLGDDYIVVLGDDRITLEDAGNYSCIAENNLGETYLNFTVTVLAPTVDEASSSAVMRLSVPEFERSVLLFEESNRGCDQDFEGEIPDQLRRGVAEECPNTVDPVTPDLLNQLLAERVLDVFPVNLVGIQVISCAYVENRDIDIERLFQRVECIVRNYPPVEDILQLTEHASAILDSRDMTLQLFAVSANGFCNPDSSGNYSWNETAAGNEATITCLTGEAVPGGLARRQCNGNAVWEEPDFSQCNEACKDRQVRLVGGSTESEGRVEVCLGIMWVTVCDSYWDFLDAKVLCSSLGYPFAKPVTNFGEKFGLLSVDCLGNESSLLDCSVDVIEEQCDAAGVVCSATGDNCTDGDIRLVGSQLESRGRVEICISGVYGTVCDDSWDIDDATVVCRQRGFPMALSALRGAYFGEGVGAIYLNEVECDGTESNLLECSHSGLHNHDCDHGDDASVECAVACNPNEFLCLSELNNCRPDDYLCDGIDDCLTAFDELNCNVTVDNCTEGDTRLVGHLSDYQGLVEVCIDRNYRRVTTDSIFGLTTIIAASLVCVQLDIPRVGVPFVSQSLSERLYFLAYNFDQCTGEESTILDCTGSLQGVPPGTFDFGVRCEEFEDCDNGEVRLVGGSHEREGRVELCYNGIWGSVGDYFGAWGYDQASVVCNQLGYNRLGSLAFTRTNFGKASDLVVCFLHCSGSESELLECPDNPGACPGADNVGVLCEDYEEDCLEGEVRLVGRSSLSQGTVQVCVSGVWQTLCTGGWDAAATNVACRSLGFPDYDHREVVITDLVYGLNHGNDDIVVVCNGTEDSLGECDIIYPVNLNGLDCSGTVGICCADYPRIHLEPESGSDLYTVEVGRELSLVCRQDIGNFPSDIIISAFKGSSLLAHGLHGVEIFAGERVSPKDNGSYSCVAQNALGTANLHFFVEVLAPAANENGSSVFVRFSVPEFARAVLLYETPVKFPIFGTSRRSSRNDDYESSEFGDETSDDQEGRLPADQLTPELFIQMIADTILDVFPEELFGIQTVSCSYVGNQAIDIERRLQRVECNITNYPRNESFLEVVERAVVVLEDGREPRTEFRLSGPSFVVEDEVELRREFQLFTVSANGFCDESSTSSSVDGNYTWPEAAAGSEASRPCRFGPEDQTAQRLCSASAQPAWQDPNFGLCYNRNPTIMFTPNDSVVDEGRRFMLTCESTGGKVFWSNHSRVTAQQPEPANFDVLDPLGSASGELSPTASGVQDGKYFFEGSTSGERPPTIEVPQPDLLYTIRNSDYSVTLVTHPLYGVVADLEDEYTCVAQNEFVSNEETIFLNVKERREAGGIIGAVRATLNGQFNEERPDQVDYYLLYIEAMLLDYIDPQNQNGQQEAIKCDEVESCSDERESRIECALYGTSGSVDINFVARLLTNRSIDVPTLPQSIRIGELRFCDCEETVTAHGDYRWVETTGGTNVSVECNLGPAEGFSVEEARAMRRCGENGEWEEERLSQCITQVTLDLQALSEENITADNFEQVSEDLTETITTSTEDDQTEDNVAIVVNVFASTAALLDDQEIVIQQSTVEGYVEVIDTIDDWDPDAVRAMGSEVIEAFETISAGLFRDDNFTMVEFEGVSVTFTADRIEVEVQTRGARFTTTMMENGTLDSNRTEGQGDDGLPPDQIASAFLPPTLFEQVEGSGDVDVIFTLFNSPTLFPVSEDKPGDNIVGSPIVGTAVAGQSFVNLPEPVIIVLRLNRLEGRNFTTVTCVSWSFELDEWISEGCTTEVSQNGSEVVVECSCNHLTNFAALVDICRRDEDCDERTEDDDSAEELALEVITYVGVGLSLIGIVATIITLLVFKRLRKRDATKLHVQLCVAIGLMLVMFAVGVDRSEEKGVCVAMSALIQYFTLVSVMWMGAEAVLMFQKLVIVFVEITTRYIIILSLVCWLTPLIPVIIPLAIDPDHMVTFDSNDDIDFCFIGEVAVFWGAFLGPIFAILLFNLVIFVVVVFVLVKHSRNSLGRMKEQQNQKTTIRLLISIAGIMSLFGLSWFFAALTVREASTAFQFLFTIFNTFQGFFLFLFFCVLSKDARELWKEVFTCGKYRSTFHPSKPYVSSSSGPARFKTAATKSTELSGTGSGGLRSDLMLSDSHASSGADRYNIHLMTSFQSTDEPDQPTLQEAQVTGADDGNVFANPAVAERTDSMDLVEETERALNVRRSREITPYEGLHEIENVEVDMDTGGGVEGGGGGGGVGVEPDLEEAGEGYGGRIRGVVV